MEQERGRGALRTGINALFHLEAEDILPSARVGLENV